MMMMMMMIIIIIIFIINFDTTTPSPECCSTDSDDSIRIWDVLAPYLDSGRNKNYLEVQDDDPDKVKNNRGDAISNTRGVNTKQLHLRDNMGGDVIWNLV